MKITIRPRGKKWAITYGQSRVLRKTPATSYAFLERKLLRELASRHAEKTSILVVYSQGHNETLKSLDPRYLLRLTAQFLEDYVTPKWVALKEKKYAA